jgi:putative nucleotidyltransferase-like protein
MSLPGPSHLRHDARTMHDPARENLLNAARTLVVDAATAEAVGVLSAAGIRCLLLRGPTLTAALYASPSERLYFDVDLLVDPREFALAEVALARHGLSESPLEVALPDERPRHAHSWCTRSGVVVDLHRTLIGVGAPPEAVWSMLGRNSGRIMVGGVVVDIPAKAALALIVALHAAHHVDDAGQAVVDLGLALDRLSPEAWSGAAVLARELNAVAAFATGLKLSTVGTAVLAELGLDSCESARSVWAKGDRRFHVAQGIAWLANTQGTRAKARFLCRRLLPSPRSMRSRSALARHGPVGLGLAYLVRWLDAARYTPAALRTIVRIRRHL